MKGTFVHPNRTRSLAVAAVGGTALAVALLGNPSMAATGHHRTPSLSPASPTRGTEGSDARSPQDFDYRQLGGTALAKAQRTVTNQRSTGVEKYYAGLGPQAVVDIDPLTGTPRQLGRLDGYLSGTHRGAARTVALDYVRSHLAALGLTSADLSTFVFRKDYVDPMGIHHLSWQQRAAGTPVFGNGLQVNVTRNGRVLSILGSPVSGLAGLARQAPASDVDATQARSRAAANVSGSVQTRAVASSSRGPAATTRWTNHDYATKVWFLTSAGLRPGWSTYVQAGTDSAYQHVIDAASGKALYRHSTTDSASGDAYVYDYYPGAPKGPTGVQGGKPKVVNFIKKGWLTKGSKVLDGKNVVTWADANDDNAVEPR